MKTLNLTNYDVKIKEKEDLTYGDVEDIQYALMEAVDIDGRGQMKSVKGQEMKKARRSTTKRVIVEIKDENGEEVKFSDKWLDNLPAEDGMKLMEEVDSETSSIGKKKKESK